MASTHRRYDHGYRRPESRRPDDADCEGGLCGWPCVHACTPGAATAARPRREPRGHRQHTICQEHTMSHHTQRGVWMRHIATTGVAHLVLEVPTTGTQNR